VVVGHGPKGSRPAGRLPVFTVNNEEEAEQLLSLACGTNMKGEYIARELAQEQTLENLNAFGDRLADIYQRFIIKETDNDS
jgi:hypothetical protein